MKLPTPLNKAKLPPLLCTAGGGLSAAFALANGPGAYLENAGRRLGVELGSCIGNNDRAFRPGRRALLPTPPSAPWCRADRAARARGVRWGTALLLNRSAAVPGTAGAAGCLVAADAGGVAASALAPPRRSSRPLAAGFAAADEPVRMAAFHLLLPAAGSDRNDTFPQRHRGRSEAPPPGTRAAPAAGFSDGEKRSVVIRGERRRGRGSWWGKQVITPPREKFVATSGLGISGIGADAVANCSNRSTPETTRRSAGARSCSLAIAECASRCSSTLL